MGSNGVGERAVFLDRDGVINRNVWNPATHAWESPLTEDEFELLPGVLPALKDLQRAKFLLFVVSNQPNYAKQKCSLQTLDAIHGRLIAQTSQAGIKFIDCYYCLHHPQGTVPVYSGSCGCRKPSPYFLLLAQKRHRLDLAKSWMIGDRVSDMECGNAAGTHTILIGSDLLAEPCGMTASAADLAEAAQVILRWSGTVG